MIYKLTAAILTIAGLILVAKYEQHLPGLIVLITGLFLGLWKGLPAR
jgi:hypothetical protein